MPTKDELDRALKAFKKRLKLTRRDQESSYGQRALTAGRTSGIIAVRPPDGFPPEVWDELCAKGRLVRTPGERTYELPPQPP